MYNKFKAYLILIYHIALPIVDTLHERKFIHNVGASVSLDNKSLKSMYYKSFTIICSLMYLLLQYQQIIHISPLHTDSPGVWYVHISVLQILYHYMLTHVFVIRISADYTYLTITHRLTGCLVCPYQCITNVSLLYAHSCICYYNISRLYISHHYTLTHRVSGS